MGSTTGIIKYPYPESSDLIAQGAVNIQQGLEATEGSLFLANNKFNSSDAFTAWPAGHSLMYVSGDTGWPYTTGQVVTIKLASTHCWQWFYTYSANSSRQAAYLRIGYNASGVPTWSKWDTIAAAGSPEAMASGSVTITPIADQVSSATVTFPSGRFQYAPAVFTQYRGGSPGVATSPSSVSATSFTINVQRSTATDTYVYWQAVSNQGE